MSTESAEVFKDSDSFHAELAKLEGEDLPPHLEEEEEAEGPQEQEATPPQEDEDEAEELPQGNLLPKSRFFKEVKKRKEIEQRFQEQREHNIRLETELNMMNQTIQEFFGKQNAPQQEEEEFAPIDPEAHTRTQKELNEIRKEQQKLSDMQIKAQYRLDMNTQQAEFTRHTPDFGEAYKHVLETKYQEFIEVGFKPEEAESAAIKDMWEKAGRLWNDGKNVPETVYKLAKAYGYKPKATKGMPNLEKIEENMKKSQSVNELPAAPSAPGGVTAFNNPEGFKKLLGSNRSVDANKFAEALKRIERSSQSYQ